MPDLDERSKRTSPPERSAIARLARDPVSRRRFMAVGGGTSLAAFLAACGGGGGSTTMATQKESMGGKGESETAEFGEGDIGILNYALTLEYLETVFYEEVVKSGLFKGEELAVLKKFGAEEAEHVEALSGTVKKLGGKPAARPKTEFPLKDAKSVAELAGTVENLGAAAYLGQATNIESPEVLAAALSIHSVEARHAATLNTLLGLSITPNGAFAAPADVKTVLKSVEPFIVG
ncbi:MAG TPA: ferritin-like domain-containing protein [Solirubrobacterales bacterium]|nr:ferritin-like domain-containing protein [Solirubrobacterales bacterium]